MTNETIFATIVAATFMIIGEARMARQNSDSGERFSGLLGFLGGFALFIFIVFWGSK